ncbi:MAG: nicotinate phosphoribosyltransferase [Spirochaetota bacterium]
MYQSALFTDLYELTMMQGYLLEEKNGEAVFDMFFRSQPFQGGFSVFAGLDPLLDRIEQIQFDTEDIEYLDSLGIFKTKFLDYLKTFRFQGEVWAMKEGSIVFPNEPIIRVHGTFIETQLLESILLNIVNFQTLIATKAARVYIASNEGTVLEFGLRRAHGIDGALSATRAAFIGGAAATSNTLAGKLYDIPVKGTMAHSWIMAFANEEEAFRKYAEIYPENVILLIDTYDTLATGINNAIKVGRMLQGQGKPFGVRLDSGDLQYLSTEVRKKLDEAGLTGAKITVSNELNEEIIHQLVTEQSPIDIWGVGTHLVTGGSQASLTGVYKLAAKNENGTLVPVIKISNNPEKTTNPGVKQVYRFINHGGSPIADLIALENEEIQIGGAYTFYHPSVDVSKFTLSEYTDARPLLEKQMEGGRRKNAPLSLRAIRDHTLHGLSALNRTYKRIINPHIYKVSISKRLKEMKTGLIRQYNHKK